MNPSSILVKISVKIYFKYKITMINDKELCLAIIRELNKFKLKPFHVLLSMIFFTLLGYIFIFPAIDDVEMTVHAGVITFYKHSWILSEMVRLWLYLYSESINNSLFKISFFAGLVKECHG